MPRDPKTGAFVTQEVYDAIIAEEGTPPPTSPAWTQPPTPAQYPPQPVKASFSTMVLTVLVIGLIGYIAVKELMGPASVPAPVPVNDVVSITAPIAAKLMGNPAKAALVENTYRGFADAVAGRSGSRVTDTKVFAAVTTALLTDIDAGTVNPIGKEIDAAVGSYLDIKYGRDAPGEAEGWEFKTFTETDRAKLVQVLQAISEAAGKAK